MHQRHTSQHTLFHWALLLLVGIVSFSTLAYAGDDDPKKENLFDKDMFEKNLNSAFPKDYFKHEKPDFYQRRLFSITLYKGISFWGTNSDNVINHAVVGLSIDRMARLQGIGVATLGSAVIEDAYGIQFATIGAVVGGDMTGLQVSAAAVTGGRMTGIQFGPVAAVTGESMHGAQLSIFASVAGQDVSPLQVGGFAAVAGNNVNAIQAGGFAAVAGGDMLGVQLGGLSSVAGGDVRGIQVGGLAAVGGWNVAIAQVGGFAAVAGRDVNAFQAGGFAAVAGREARGIQAGGFAAVSGKGMLGIQAGGLAAVSGEEMLGIQVSGMASVSGERMRGIQVAGLANVAATNMQGAQIGTINFGANQQGIQIGAINASESLHGLQIGITNSTFDLHGLQIGLINVIEGDDSGIHLGAITRIAGEKRYVEVGYGAEGSADINYITGNRMLRSIVSVKVAPWDNPDWWMLGGGIGTQHTLLPNILDVELDGLVYKINDGDFWTSTEHWMITGRLIGIVPVTNTVSIYGGASYNNMTSRLNNGERYEAIPLDDSVNYKVYHRTWIGYQVGIRTEFTGCSIFQSFFNAMAI